MIIVMGRWKQKVLKVLGILVLIMAFVMAVPAITGMLVNQVPAFSGWLQDEHPSGNPMRVETDENSGTFNQVLDQFVIKLQDFYYER
ncbi:hypothetical protein ASZ90_017916 [hydrocarbon metagenome]|uniref:Uncharacterized protein n=1 Tax=hydrocarbon metagenome TaxID=938273 RepID=A0A0W8E898_9ZZZZ